jgi:hypothetical protein
MWSLTIDSQRSKFRTVPAFVFFFLCRGRKEQAGRQADWSVGLSEQISRVADGNKTISGAAKSRHVDIQKQFDTSL